MPAHLVRRDLLAVARTAEDDPERGDAGILIPHDGLRGADAERRIVVQRVVLDRSVIDHLVSVSGEVVLELRRELQSCVVGGEMDAHGVNPRSGATGWRAQGSEYRRRPA